MSLSCSCDYNYDFEPGDWAYDPINLAEYDFIPLNTSKRKRCCSCGNLININALCLIHPRSRYPYDDLESRKKLSQALEDAFNQEPLIPMADHYQCERCGEIWLNLQAAGYECLSPHENMENSLKEYWDLAGFDPSDTAREAT